MAYRDPKTYLFVIIVIKLCLKMKNLFRVVDQEYSRESCNPKFLFLFQSIFAELWK